MFKKLIAAILVLIITVGCSTSWVAQAEQIVTAVLPIVANTLTLVMALRGKTMSAQDAAFAQSVSQQVTTDVGTVHQLLSDYKAADSAQAQDDTISKIDSALAAVQKDEDSLLAGMHISDEATKAKITAIVSLVSGEIQSVQALLPAKTGRMTASHTTLLSAKQLRQSFSKELHKPTGDPVVDAATASIR